ncbi:hypothetical protein C4D60_Mb04t13000 [Musa balbisiana]|uniref:Uncharacterized protein n=1 Tax=Musa balbisiana TaxID=52838 RepID=A0A4S8KBM4_MUSBA|nr:hypothetical protein C4D60_Mb04t13000 [Musa balbisiana]
MAASKSMLLFLLVLLVVFHAQARGSDPSKRMSIINTITNLGRRLPLAPPSPLMAPPRILDPRLLPPPASPPSSCSAAPPPPPPPPPY